MINNIKKIHTSFIGIITLLLKLAEEMCISTNKVNKYQKIKTSIAYLVLFSCFCITGLAKYDNIKGDLRIVHQYIKKNHAYKEIEITKLTAIQAGGNAMSTMIRELVTQSPTIISIITSNPILAQNYAVTIGTAYAITKIIKIIINTKRPDAINGESFPSGHATSAALGSTFIAIKYGFLASMPLYLLTFFVGFLRVYTSQHYITDVIAGIIFGMFLATWSNTIILQICNQARRIMRIK